MSAITSNPMEHPFYRGEVIFNLYDRDRSGTLTVEELSKALSSCGMEPEEIEELFGQSDENADGVVSFDEFAKLMGSTGLFDLTG